MPNAATEPREAKSQSPNRPPRWLRILAISVAAIVVAHFLDGWAWAHVKDPNVYERDWGRMLRSAGFLPTWFIVAIALAGHDRGTPGWRWRGGMLALAPTVGGLIAELLKLVVRRLRPGDASADYVFRPYFTDPWSNKGMGMPSSHVLVAAAAATVLARLFPRVWWLWYAIAAGCAYTRVAAGAHYVSDTVVAAVLGWFIGAGLMHWGMHRRRLLLRAAAQ